MSSERFEVAQEDDRVAARPVLAVFGAAVVITVVAVWAQAKLLDRKRADVGAVEVTAAPVASTQIDGIHQTMIERDRHGLELKARQRASLEGWGWIDRDHGLARIPIERAMDLLVAQPSMISPSPSASVSQ